MKILTPNIISGSIGNTNMDSISITNSTVSGSFSGSFQGDGSGLTGVGGGYTTVYKTVDESVANSTTIQEDNELRFTPDINSTYLVKFSIIIDGDAAADAQIKITFPSGSTIRQVYGGYNSYSGAFVGSELIMVAQLSGIGGFNRRFIFPLAIIDVGGTIGEIGLSWAQNASNAIATTVYAGSIIEYLKIN